MAEARACGTGAGGGVVVVAHGDRPPSDSRTEALVWWLTRPWTHMFAALTLIAMTAGSLMLAVYLGKIGHLELLQGVIASKAGLVLIVAGAALLSAGLMVVFFGSVWFVDIAASVYDRPVDVPTALPSRTPR